MGSVTGIVTVELLGSKNIGLTLATGNAADGVTLTVDSSSLTGNATINAQADTDGLIVVTAGTGDDTIQGSSSDNGDSISAGAGDDTISFGSADLTVADTVDGGAGANTLSFNEALAHALEDADFTEVSNVQTLSATGASSEIVATIGAEAAAAGITTVTFVAGGTGAGHDDLTVGAAFTNNLTVNLDADGDKNIIDASAYTGSLTITADDIDIDTMATAKSIAGGTGSDTLQITSDAGTDAIAAVDIDTITKIETFQFLEATDTTATASIELADANAAYTSATVYDTLTVNTTALSGASTIDAEAEAMQDCDPRWRWR